MKFNGKELLIMGVPQKEIKFCIGVEFDSPDAVFPFLRERKPVKEKKQSCDTWVDWIWRTFPHLPMVLNGDTKTGIPIKMSKSELRRVFERKSIEINGIFPGPDDECREEDFPIFSLTWFPNSVKTSKSPSKKTSWK
jgi:hypothetical protein